MTLHKMIHAEYSDTHNIQVLTSWLENGSNYTVMWHFA